MRGLSLLLVMVTSLLAIPATCLSQAPADSTIQDTSGAASIAFSRRHRDGEELAYHIKAANKGRYQTTADKADVNCVVKKDALEAFVEDSAWSNLVVNSNPVALSAAAQNFRQPLSLDPCFHGRGPGPQSSHPSGWSDHRLAHVLQRSVARQ